MRKLILKTTLTFCFILSILAGTQEIKATEGTEKPYTQVEDYADATYTESLKSYTADLRDVFEADIALKKGKVKFDLTNNYDRVNENSKITYQIQVASNAKFKNAKSFTTNKSSYSISKSAFGTNGGTIYFRVRFYDNGSGKKIYSSWGETKSYNFVRLNKANFPSLYKLLKDGYQSTINGKNTVVKYDKNDDGWLDPAEIYYISSINSSKAPKEHHTKISSIKGVEYLTNLSSLRLYFYSGSKIDLSANKSITSLAIGSFTAKTLTINAPNVLNFDINGRDTKLKTIDLSKCNSAVEICVTDDRGINSSITNVKFPTSGKWLRELRVWYIPIKSLNLDKYTNLEELDLFGTKIGTLNVSKCKNLAYMFICRNNTLKSLDVKANTKLKGIDVYECKYLTKSKVKANSKTKVTQNKGEWYENSSAYKTMIEKRNVMLDERDAVKDADLEMESIAVMSAGKAKFTWDPLTRYAMGKDTKVSVTYQIQIADNADFKKAKSFTTTKNTYSVAKSNLGANGGTYYFRIRCYKSFAGQKVYSKWTEPEKFNCVKINKTNFPGMYKVLKNSSYDKNSDGWLDQQEIGKIVYLTSIEETISSFEGIKYLPSVEYVEVEKFSGTKIDLADTNVDSVNAVVTAKSISVIAPKATTISLCVADKKKSLSTIDLTKCYFASHINVTSGDETKLLKLPKNKWRLNELFLYGMRFKDIDLSVYKNLEFLQCIEDID